MAILLGSRSVVTFVAIRGKPGRVVSFIILLVLVFVLVFIIVLVLVFVHVFTFVPISSIC